MGTNRKQTFNDREGADGEVEMTITLAEAQRLKLLFEEEENGYDESINQHEDRRPNGDRGQGIGDENPEEVECGMVFQPHFCRCDRGDKVRVFISDLAVLCWANMFLVRVQAMVLLWVAS